MTSFSIFDNIEKNQEKSKVLDTFENIMENGANKFVQFQRRQMALSWSKRLNTVCTAGHMLAYQVSYIEDM